jgi:hypothetical protein
MDRARLVAINAAVLCTCIAAVAKVAALPTGANLAGVAPEVVSQIAAQLIAEAIPREYERSKDWGKTKRVATGVRSYGNFFDFDIHKKTSEVNDGVWKKYRLTLVNPDKNLDVRVENLRSLESGKYALTLLVSATVHGWARAKVYERGVHVIALEAEGDSSVRLSIDAEISVETVSTGSLLPGVAINPVVTAARLKLHDFRLNRISDVRGPIAHELGVFLREAVEDELKGPKLVAKLNHSIEKRRDRLRLTPDMLLGKSAVKEKHATGGPDKTN